MLKADKLSALSKTLFIPLAVRAKETVSPKPLVADEMAVNIIKKAWEIECLSSNVTVVKAWSVGNLLKERQSAVFRFLNVFPSTRNRSQIIHLKLKG